MATKGLYQIEMADISWMLKKLNKMMQSEWVCVTDGARIPVTVERGEHGAATHVGHLECNGADWTFAAHGGV